MSVTGSICRCAGQAGNVTLEAHVQQYKENSGDVGQWNDTVLPPHFHSG